MTPMACRTALRLSRPKTAGWLIHSNDAASSVSSADMTSVSMPAAGVKGPIGSRRGGVGVRLGSIEIGGLTDIGGGGRGPVGGPEGG